MKQFQLVDLEVDKVANVDSPANKRRYLVVKRVENESDATAKGGEKMTWSQKIKDSIQKAISGLSAVAEEVEKAEGLELEVVEPEPTQKREGVEKVEKITLDDVLKSLASDEERKVIEDEIAKARTAEADPEPEEIDKSELSEPVRKRLEALEEQAVELAKRTEEAETIAKSEREKREWSELVKRAELMPFVGAADEVAKDLKEAYGVSEEFGKRLEERYNATNERLRQSDLFDEVGKSTPSENSPEGQLEALAKKHQEANVGTTYEKAYDVICKANPHLLNDAVQKGV